MYRSSQVAGSLLGTVPALDDASLFGGLDPAPQQGDVATAAPIGVSGLNTNFFDLDGYDALSNRLSNFDLNPDAPLNQPLLRQSVPVDCIYPAQSLAMSFSDDSTLHWGAAIPPRIPTEGFSPLGFLYGTTTGQNEVFAADIDVTGGFPATLLGLSALRDEEQVHIDLAPNPTFASVENDDDIDALDDNFVQGCQVHYFSVDSEARMSLDPGVIYQQSGAGGPSVAIRPFHFGLPAGVDIDAFEFAWLPTPNGAALAVLYSVKPDNPVSVNDESGGANPSTLYGSFLTGSSFVVLNGPANAFDNIDAITVSEPPVPDTDGDGIDDSQDNCTLVANPNQVDADGDGIGNMCDSDLNQDCTVSFPDLAIFRTHFFTSNPVSDFDSNGIVNFQDLVQLRVTFFNSPGPAAEPNVCSP